MKKITIPIMVFILIFVGATLKANTKTRVNDLEQTVEQMAKSEKDLWNKIEDMNQKVTELEQHAAIQYYENNRVFADDDDDEYEIDEA